MLHRYSDHAALTASGNGQTDTDPTNTTITVLTTVSGIFYQGNKAYGRQ